MMPPNARSTVLLVEDEEYLRRVTQRILTEEGFDVVSVADGHSGVSALRDNAADIAAVILDLALPGLDGTQALRQMRTLRPDVFVVVTSGLELEELDTELRSDPALVFLRKPFPQSELVELLRATI